MAHVSPSPSPAPTARPVFDGHAGTYEEDHRSSVRASGEDPNYFHDYKIACLERLGVPDRARVLDYGCGIGNLTSRFVTRFEEVHGYDPSGESLARAKERAPGATLHDDPSTIPNAHFDVAVLSGVLHHVAPAERGALLEAVRAHLKPGGRVVVFEHNPLNPLTRRAVAACTFDDDAILLWPWEAKRTLERAGFSRVSLDYIVFFPRALARLRPFEPSLRRLAVGAQQMLVGERA